MKSIRLAAPRDARGVAEIYAPAVERSVISFETEVPTEGEIESRIAKTLAFAPWLVCVDVSVDPENVEGYAYASRHHERAAYRWSVDVSVYVHERCRRAGVGRALYTSLLALLQLQGFCAAHAGITLPNAPSVGIHESFGFQPVAVYPRVGFKFGAWHDVGWWPCRWGARRGPVHRGAYRIHRKLELRPRTGEPAPTLSVEALRQSEGWDAALATGRRHLSR